MAINWYSVKRVFPRNPSDLPQLRESQREKLAQLEKDGSFAFAVDGGDRQPVLVISWKNDADKKDYWKLVKAAKYIKGTYKASKTKGYEFTTDEPSKALLKDYLALDDDALSIAFWNLIGMEANTIKVNGTALTRRSLLDKAEWTIAEWNVSRILVTDKAMFDKAPIQGAKEVTEGGQKCYATPHGLLLPKDFTISIQVKGKLVSKAEANPHSAAYFRDQIPAVFKPLVKALADELNAVDAKLATEKDPAKRLALRDQAKASTKKFEEAAHKAIPKKAEEQWLKLLEAQVDYRDFQVDMAVKITLGAVTLVIGAVGTGFGGITGIGAILGLVGTIKGGLETVSTIYTAFRDVDGLGEEINVQLARALVAKSAAGWQDFGKTVLGNLPGGKIVQMGLAKVGARVKSADDIGNDLKAYNGKVSGLLKQAADLGKKVEATLKASQDALAALETPALKQLEKADAVLKKRNDALRKDIGDATTKFLDEIGSLTQRFDDGKDKVKHYADLLELLKKEVDKDKVAKALKDYFVPLLSLPWGVDPANLSNTIMTTASVTLDILNPVLGELNASEQTKDVAKWLKIGNDLATTLKVATGK